MFLSIAHDYIKIATTVDNFCNFLYYICYL